MMLPTIKDATDRLRFLNLRRRRVKMREAVTELLNNLKESWVISSCFALKDTIIKPFCRKNVASRENIC